MYMTFSFVSTAQYNVDKSKMSTSGFSSGGAMTVLFHAVHSSSLMGVAAFAGGNKNAINYMELANVDFWNMI